MFDPAHLVFLDETAANTKMMRVGGRCLRGERLIGQVLHGHFSAAVAGGMPLFRQPSSISTQELVKDALRSNSKLCRFPARNCKP